MAHEIWESDNMLSVKQVPWHGLGIVLDDYPSIEEAQRLSGLDWTVRKEQIYYRMPQQEGISRLCKVDGNFAIVRDDTNDPLSVVGKDYEPFQNDQMFAFMENFLQAADSKIETCGSLRNGRIVWAMCKAGNTEYLKNDPIAQYFLFKNSFDTSQNVEVCFTDVRVVCNNTLQAALRDAKNGYRVRHTQAMHKSIELIGEALAANRKYHESLAAVMHKMTAKSLSSAELTKSAAEIVLADTVDAEILAEGGNVFDILSNHQEKTVNKILELHENGLGTDISGVRGTVYGLLNACTEYADHHRIIRPGDRALQEAKFESVMMGSAFTFKNRAFAYCQQLAA